VKIGLDPADHSALSHPHFLIGITLTPRHRWQQLCSPWIWCSLVHLVWGV